MTTLQPTSKALSALKKVLESVGMPHLYQKILNNAGTKQQRQADTLKAFKAMASQLPKDDMASVRQLSELIAQVDNEPLRLQLEAIVKELFTPEKVKGLPFYRTEATKPKPFDYGIFHKSKSTGNIFTRMFRGKSK